MRQMVRQLAPLSAACHGSADVYPGPVPALCASRHLQAGQPQAEGRRPAAGVALARLRFEDLYAAWPENLTHDLPHGGRPPDAAGVAAVDDHPRWACQTRSDYFTPGRSDV